MASAVQGTDVDICGVEAPLTPPLDALRDGYFQGVREGMLGAIWFRDLGYGTGPLTLLRFGEPRFEHPEWVYPIESGLLVQGPGGELRLGWQGGRLQAVVRGMRPRLPGPLYRRTQLPFHHGISRIALLHMRGRLPSAGVPAEPWRRGVAGALDVLAALGVVSAVAPRRATGRVAWFAAALVAGQTLVPLLSRGRTVGGWLAGTRITGVDAAPPGALQLLVRVAALPRSVSGLRDRHDELVGTEVVRAPAPLFE